MLDKRKKIIIDTDNGDDIDDLIALYFALHLKEHFEIIGIVCSFLNSPLRKKQIEHVLKLANITNIPVYAGSRKPLKAMHGSDISSIYCQYLTFLGTPEDEDENSAIDFIIESAKKYQNNLTIVEIAPETTLAKVILKNKDALKNVNITLMAGDFRKGEYEWNIECDAIASKIVMESDLKLSYIGCDQTLKTTLENKEIENYFLRHYEDQYLNFLSLESNIWRICSGRPIVLHDPLALLTVIDDKLCEFESVNVTHLDDGEHCYTILDSQSSHKVQIAKSVDLERLYSYVFDLMKGENNEK